MKKTTKTSEFKNFTPYKPKKGEEYMNENQKEHFRGILRNWRAELMEEVDRTVTHMKDEAANFPDPNHARFYLEQMWRCGHISAEDAQSVNLQEICLDDFYRVCIGRTSIAGDRVENYSEFLERIPR